MNTTTIPAHLADTYSASEKNTGEPAAPAKLFSIGQIGVATFLAVPAGLTLMALNFRRIGKMRQANSTFILAPVATALLVLLGFALPEGTPTIFIPLLIALAAKKVAMKEFGETIAAMDTNGGSIESRWTVAGAVIAGLILSVAMAVLAISIFPNA